MTALSVIESIGANDYLRKADFLRYCFVNKQKVPFQYNGTDSARPNVSSDFVPLGQLDLTKAAEFAGVGVSIQASGICAIDIDKCFRVPFDLSTADGRAQDIINIFGDKTYIEFSFSGTGLRILFRAAPISDYEKRYYIKNSRTQCEYYYPQGSNRYVTMTGRTIIYAGINFLPEAILKVFLDTYMIRPIKSASGSAREPIQGDRNNLLLHFLRTNKSFQDNWFDKAPGSGSNESERDFFLLKFIFENISNNQEEAKTIFEESPFFKSKDRKHIYKWTRADNRYFNYLYNVISGGE
nr:MAG TPA: Primase-pol, Primase, REPLICATION [Caudoviricetes sp.]